MDDLLDFLWDIWDWVDFGSWKSFLIATAILMVISLLLLPWIL